MDTLTTILTSLFSSAGVVILWEGLIKPERVKRRTARMVAEECALLNMMCVEAYTKALEGGHAPHSAFDLPTPVFDTVASQIGDLDQVADIVAAYGYIRATVRMASAWSAGQEMLERNTRSALDRLVYTQRLEDYQKSFLSAVSIALDLTAPLVASLRDTARVDDGFGPEKPLREVLSSAQARERMPFLGKKLLGLPEPSPTRSPSTEEA